MSAHMCRQYRRNLLLAGLVCLSVYTSIAFAEVTAIIAPPTPGATYNLTAFNNITMPFFGVPLTVLAMAAAGALIGAGYTDPVESRKKLYFLTLANTMFAAWFVILIPEWRGWAVSDVALPPLAGVIAAANCVVVPMLFKRLPQYTTRALDAMGEVISRIFNRPPTKGGEQ